jgi:son of sevenless-like protein
VDARLLSELKKLCSSERNFESLRSYLKSLQPPCVPYLGLYQTDLTFIEDGNKNWRGASMELVNFDKCTKVGACVKKIQMYGGTPFAEFIFYFN